MSLTYDLSSRANARDLAREWLERGREDPSVASLPRDDSPSGGRDRAEDPRPGGARRGGDVSRLSVQREIAEQGEGDSLLRVTRKKELVEEPKRMTAGSCIEVSSQSGH